MRARELVARSAFRAPSRAVEGGSSRREQWLSAAEGRIVGRPDVIHGDTVIDYKSGEIYEYGSSTVAKASYVRQLQSYAFLIHACTGRWPSRGVLLPMEGPPFEVVLDPIACESCASDALERLEQYNCQVDAMASAIAFANPSPESCKWCPYQMVCPAFWKAAADGWSEQMGSASISGPALDAARPIHGGAAFALTVSATSGAIPSGEVTLAPLNPEFHSSLSRVASGTLLRVTGLARRRDGTVVPVLRTLVARVEDLPLITVADKVARRDA